MPELLRIPYAKIFWRGRCEHPEEWIVGRRRSVRVQSKDDTAEVRVVGLGPAELVVGYSGPEWTVGEVLSLTPPAFISNDDIEFSVRPESKNAAILVAPQRLAGISLKGAELNKVPVKCQRRSIPHETVHAVAEERHGGPVRGVDTHGALSPVQIHAAIAGEVRVQGNSQEPALRERVHWKIQHGALDSSVDDAQIG